tara:strand:- start:1214 stop:1585 length:372 start_codon:yes stop_codon:yes gene_type:complete
MRLRLKWKFTQGRHERKRGPEKEVYADYKANNGERVRVVRGIFRDHTLKNQKIYFRTNVFSGNELVASYIASELPNTPEYDVEIRRITDQLSEWGVDSEEVAAKLEGLVMNGVGDEDFQNNII